MNSPDPQPTQALPKKSLRLVFWIVPLFGLVAGLWLRFKIASGELFWLDELHTGWASGGGFQQMLTRSAQGNQPPLYFAVVWCWRQFVPTSEFNLRLISLVANGLLMIGAAACVWRSTRSLAAATLVLFWIAVDDSFIWFATEARPYAMLHAMALLQIVSFCSVLQLWARPSPLVGVPARQTRPPGRYIVLAVSSSACLWIHYTAGLLLIAELSIIICLLLVGRRHPIGVLVRQQLKRLLLTMTGAVVLTVPLLWQLKQSQGVPADWKQIASPIKFWQQIGFYGLVWFGLPLFSVVIARALAKYSSSNRGDIHHPAEKTKAGIFVTLATIFCLPVGLVGILDTWFDIPLVVPRYLASCVIAGPLFVGMLLGRQPAKVRALASIVLVVGTALVYARYQRLVPMIVDKQKIPLLRIENWPAAIDAINQDAGKSNQPLFLFGGILEDSHALYHEDSSYQDYLKFPLGSIYGLRPSDRVVLAGPTVESPHFDPSMIRHAIDHGGAWVLVRHQRQQARSIVVELLEELERHGQTEWQAVELGHSSEWVHLYSLDRRPND